MERVFLDQVIVKGVALGYTDILHFIDLPMLILAWACLVIE